GVTPVLGLGCDWLRHRRHPLRLRAARDVWHQAGKTRSLRKLKRLYFYWICPDCRAFEWFAALLQDLERDLQRMDGDDYAQLLDIRVHLTGSVETRQAREIASREGDEADCLTGLRTRTHYGRPNWDLELRNLAAKHPDTSIGIFFCGPGQLAKDLNGSGALALALFAVVWLPVPPVRAGISPAWQSWSLTRRSAAPPAARASLPPPRLRRHERPEAGRHQLGLLPGGERKPAKECLPCRAYVICPQNGGWGEWGASGPTASSTPPRKPSKRLRRQPPTPPPLPWSAARTTPRRSSRRASTWRRMRRATSTARSRAWPCRQGATRSSWKRTAGKGSRTRVRRCDRPPPDSKGLRCGGGNHGRLQKEDCEVPCSADTDFLAMAKEMLAQDLTETPNQLFYVNYGAPATLDCANEAYSLALSIVKPYQHLPDQLAPEQHEASKAVSRHTKLEMAQVRSFGTQLTIDPVDADKVGLYACYMAAVVRWYQNGLPKREHLLADWYERNWTLAPVLRGHTGAWEYYLVLDSRNQWKTNEFKLSISKQLFFLQKFNDPTWPTFIAGCALILYAIVGFPLAVVTLRQREENWITPRSSAA
uniref:NAD_binding_6 domain-containing protein n=1 Tax=Macrostomum lignano TaxID=282301 RepID=A0A1I8IXU9_9PLAT